MRNLLIAVAAVTMLVAGGSAQAAGRRSYSYYPQQSYSYYPQQNYSYYTYPSQTRRPGIFGAIMDFERRKNEFLFGPR